VEWIIVLEEKSFEGEYAFEDGMCASVDIQNLSTENRSAQILCLPAKEGRRILKETGLR
jgi:hypothetical protein